MTTTTIVETAWPRTSQLIESLLWSLLVRLCLGIGSVDATVRLLDRIPRGGPVDRVSIPTEEHFGRAGACLGRQLARSQYLRIRGRTSTVAIGVRPLRADGLDAHAWLEELDPDPDHAIIHRIRRPGRS